MDRAFYQSEIDDPDLEWLVSSFLSERPDFIAIESSFIPFVLIPYIDLDLKNEKEDEQKPA